MRVKTSELNKQQLNDVVSGIEGSFGRFATDWEFGGPIIEDASISIDYIINDSKWLATLIDGPAVSEEFGDTALVAAMRCYVASVLGDYVEIHEPEPMNLMQAAVFARRVMSNASDFIWLEKWKDKSTDWTPEVQCEELRDALHHLHMAIQAAKSCPPCHGDCNQGRNCPARNQPQLF